MKTYHILYNSKSGSRIAGIEACARLVKKRGSANLVDVQKIENHCEFISKIPEEDIIVICGGDGTLNHYINGLRGFKYPNKVLYYPGGSGNDFYHDVREGIAPRLVNVTKYIKELPVAYINGEEYTFINGVGCGLDGYCCQLGEEKRKAKTEKVNYTAMAIKAILFDYNPADITVTVDGVEHSFENVWLSPLMQGRYFGGGMKAAPHQKRDSGELTLVVVHGASKLRLLTILPSVFTGEHIKYEKYVSVFTGKEIKISYDVPKPVQIDGEIIPLATDITAKVYSEE